ncbi:glycoside hydrolase family 16 protein [Sphingomonas sp. BK345]|uniref:glycoside hydrolase family 16 protein n=1 Tax=Sphingomonas sp. BK345 TaxID=2586980 RepID=UPI0016221CCC|nr:glycoside hydrolase family 16 protein [Sphingomonas sp. BK345]MBB3474133.1 beta-glucanase (GH16 family) [Sphingomonas sp. BK345]
MVVRYHLGILGLSAALLAMAADGQVAPDGGWSQRQWSTAANGTSLSLSDYALTFSDDFNSLDCVEGKFGRPSGAHNWYSYGKFGAATFAPCDAGAASPVQVKQGRLVITLSNQGGRWQSGSVASMSPSGEGFKQTYGLFSARIRLPKLDGVDLKVWPAFWLLARYTRPGSGYAYSEMDVMENFGSDLRQFHTTLYEWPPKPLVRGLISTKRAKRLDVPMAIYDGQWHTYSVDWSPSWWKIYVDGKMVGRLAPQPDQTLPMYPIIDLALYKEPGASAAAQTYAMEVDWVRVYARKNGASPTPDAGSAAAAR